MVLGKSWQFFYFFTLVKIGQEIVFLERINGFFKLLNQADNYVEKLLVHGFGQKLGIYSLFSFSHRTGKCVLRYSILGEMVAIFPFLFLLF